MCLCRLPPFDRYFYHQTITKTKIVAPLRDDSRSGLHHHPISIVDCCRLCGYGLMSMENRAKLMSATRLNHDKLKPKPSIALAETNLSSAIRTHAQSRYQRINIDNVNPSRRHLLMLVITLMYFRHHQYDWQHQQTLANEKLTRCRSQMTKISLSHHCGANTYFFPRSNFYTALTFSVLFILGLAGCHSSSRIFITLIQDIA